MEILPELIQQLTESTSIALARSIECKEIVTNLSKQAIATTYVHQGSGGTPILLLHGFDKLCLGVSAFVASASRRK